MEPRFKEWDNDLKLEYKQLLMLEKNLVDKALFDLLPNPDDDSQDFLSRVVLKRINVLKLPLKFNFLSLHFLSDMTQNAGRIVVALIDLLNKFELTPDSEPRKIMLKDVEGLYQGRNYSDEYFVYKANEIKKGNVNWNWIY